MYLCIHVYAMWGGRVGVCVCMYKCVEFMSGGEGMNGPATHVCIHILILSFSSRHGRRRRRDSYNLISDVVVGLSSSLEAAARALPMEEEGGGDGDGEHMSLLFVLLHARANAVEHDGTDTARRCHLLRFQKVTQFILCLPLERTRYTLHSPPFHLNTHTHRLIHLSPFHLEKHTHMHARTHAQPRSLWCL